VEAGKELTAKGAKDAKEQKKVISVVPFILFGNEDLLYFTQYVLISDLQAAR